LRGTACRDRDVSRAVPLVARLSSAALPARSNQLSHLRALRSRHQARFCVFCAAVTIGTGSQVGAVARRVRDIVDMFMMGRMNVRAAEPTEIDALARVWYDAWRDAHSAIVVMRVDSNLVLTGLRTLDDVRTATPAIAERHMQTRLMVVFAVIALVVSAIGVYGVSAYATEARSREFGIRMALGASRQRVVWLVLRDGAGVGALGVIVGVPLAWSLASRLRDMLYEVTPFDGVTASVVVSVLLVVVVASALVPARRATRIDPATTMRTE